MPKRHTRKVLSLRGKGGFKEIYTAAKNWSNKPSGKIVMQAGRNLLDLFFPGAGRVAENAMHMAGWGAYRGSKNTILEASPVPIMHAMPDRGVRIVHKEFIGQLSSSTSFTNTRYPINPGLSYVFPWLSGIASSFQKYKVNGLIFYFKNTAANMVATTNNALGAIVGCTQYNPYENEPASIAEVLNISGVNESKPSEDCIFPLECDKFHSVYPTYFVREKSVIDDLAKYDPGVFNLSTYGSQAATVVGQLWVAYDITLIQPMPESVTGFVMPSGMIECSCSGTVGSANPYGSDTPSVLRDLTQHYGSIPITISNNAIDLPSMKVPTVFSVEWTVYGAGAASTAWPSTTLSNCSLRVAAVGTAAINSTVSAYKAYFTITDPNVPSSITWVGGSGPSGSLNSAISRVAVSLFDGTEFTTLSTDRVKPSFTISEDVIDSDDEFNTDCKSVATYEKTRKHKFK